MKIGENRVTQKLQEKLSEFVDCLELNYHIEKGTTTCEKHKNPR